MIASRVLLGLAGAAIALTDLPVAAAQGGGRVVVAGELGLRTFTGEPRSTELGKFLEYRSMSEGLVAQQFRLRWMPADSFRLYSFAATNLGQVDQQMTLRLSEPGAWDVQAKWDRVPHLFSTNARSLGSLSGANTWTLPAPRPDTTAWATTAPAIAPVRTMWDAVRLTAGYSKWNNWDSKAELSNVTKKGFRPLGMPFGSPGNNFREIQEPIDQTQRDARLTQSYQSDRVQVMATYAYSIFDNALDAVIADNPLLAADTPTGGAARGRMALAPSNAAHTGVLNASLRLPWRTRVSASGTYSTWTQDQAFIPATINAAIVDSRITTLPTSLDGRAGTAQWYVTATTRPADALTFTAKLREFRYRDNTELHEIPFRIVNDRSVSGIAEREAIPYNRKYGDLSGSWRLERTTGWPITLGAGWAWDHWVRSPHRNVYRTTDRSPRVSMDVALGEYASLFASFVTAQRRGSDPYIQNTTVDAPDHRRFDQADRDRERTNLVLSADPLSMLTLSGSWSVGHDEYPASPYGVQSDQTTMYGGDATWTITERATLFAGYARETFLTRFRSRYRTTGQLNNLSYDWVANNVDAINTVNAGFRVTVVPDRVELGGQYDKSSSEYQMRTFNPITPTGGTATQNFAATASDLPTVTSLIEPFGLYVMYRYSPEWELTLRYQGERYRQNDFRSVGLKPYEGGGVFLGHDYLPYDAKFVTMSVSWHPAALRILRSALP